MAAVIPIEVFKGQYITQTYSFPAALYMFAHPLENFWDPLDRTVLKSIWKNTKKKKN